jgi:hypothetical protein
MTLDFLRPARVDAVLEIVTEPEVVKGRTTKAKPGASFSVPSNSARWLAPMSRRWLVRPRSMYRR